MLSQAVWLQQRDTSRIKGAAHNKIQCVEKEGKISKDRTPCTVETCFSICFSFVLPREIYEMSELVNVVDAGEATSTLG